MSYSREIIDRIKQETDIVDIIGENVNLKKRGANYIALSPFSNEKTPSFVVSRHKQIFKDFSSGKAGNCFTFLMEYNGVTFREAVEILANRLGITLDKSKDVDEKNKNEILRDILSKTAAFYADQLSKSEHIKALNYFKARGWGKEIQDAFQLGFSPDSWDITKDYLKANYFAEQDTIDSGIILKTEKGNTFDRFKGRVIFPIRDYLGRVLGFGGRDITGSKETAKYINSPQTEIYDKSRVVYGIYEAKNEIRNESRVFICEGYADVITMHKFGFKNTVAASGTAFTIEQLNLIKRYSNQFCFIFDADTAGIKAAIRALELVLPNDIDPQMVLLPEGDDPDSVLNKHGKNTMMSYIDSAVDFVEFVVNFRKKDANFNTATAFTNLVNELIGLAALIPDFIRQDFYINKIINLLGLSQRQAESLYKLRDKLSKNKNYSKPAPEQGLKVRTNIDNVKDVLNETILLEEERILIRYALASFEHLNELIDQHELSSEFFISHEGGTLFGVMSGLVNDGHTTLLDCIALEEDIDQNTKSTLIGLAIEDEQPSENWLQLGYTLPNEDKKQINDAIISLQLKHIEKSIEELTVQLEMATLEEEKYSIIEQIKSTQKTKLDYFQKYMIED